MTPTPVLIGHPLLRRKVKPFSRRKMKGRAFLGLLYGMAKAMRRWKGVGLAANQAGLDAALFVMECRGSRRYPQAPTFPLQAYLNPRILRCSKARTKDWEGCLSVPGYRGLVPRSKEVVLEALLANGRKVKRTFRGFEARVVQHEVDHLNGLCYLDRMESMRSLCHLDAFNKRFGANVKDKN
jgi:peptide deformylase